VACEYLHLSPNLHLPVRWKEKQGLDEFALFRYECSMMRDEEDLVFYVDELDVCDG
jgi:hypothetical protein